MKTTASYNTRYLSNSNNESSWEELDQWDLKEKYNLANVK